MGKQVNEQMINKFMNEKWLGRTENNASVLDYSLSYNII